jgi:hypothetical protein
LISCRPMLVNASLRFLPRVRLTDSEENTLPFPVRRRILSGRKSHTKKDANHDAPHWRHELNCAALFASWKLLVQVRP